MKKIKTITIACIVIIFSSHFLQKTQCHPYRQEKLVRSIIFKKLTRASEKDITSLLEACRHPRHNNLHKTLKLFMDYPTLSEIDVHIIRKFILNFFKQVPTF